MGSVVGKGCKILRKTRIIFSEKMKMIMSIWTKRKLSQFSCIHLEAMYKANMGL